MVKSGFRIIVLLSLVLLLSSCLGPKTPQEIALAFWMAVINNDVEDVVKYSTLTEAKHYDAFSRDWNGYQLKWGREIIDENTASIVSDFFNSIDHSHGNRRFITYLVKRNKQWKVDYKRTRISVHGGALGNLLDKLNLLGADLNKQLNSSAIAFKLAMDRVGQELEQIGRLLDYEASKSINKYAEELQHNIQELEDSINRALKGDHNLYGRDRRILRVVAKDLEQNRETLDNPSIAAISRSSRNIGKTRQLLESLNSDAVAKYRNDWRNFYQKIAGDMRSMLDELSSRLYGNTAY